VSKLFYVHELTYILVYLVKIPLKNIKDFLKVGKKKRIKLTKEMKIAIEKKSIIKSTPLHWTLKIGNSVVLKKSEKDNICKKKKKFGMKISAFS